MNDIAVFDFKGDGIRVILDDAGEPKWIATEVCKVAAIKNVSMALSRLDDDEKGISTIDTLGGPQELLTISESGLYSLILTSRKPEAKAFKKWITSEVLPAIRKTGQYKIPAAQVAPAVDPIIASMQAIIEMRQEQIAQAARIDQIEAKADAALARGGDTGFVSLVGYCKINDILITRNQMAIVGRGLTRHCKINGIPVGEVKDERYGSVNTYRVEILDAWRDSPGGPGKGTPQLRIV